MLKGLLVVILLAVAAAGGVAAGYYLWGIHKNWYAVDIAKLGPGAENDLIRYGRDLIVNTPKHLGKNAVNPAMRYAGNDLACQNCHLNAGLQPFAAPFISTFASFPMMVDDQVLTLTRRHQWLHAAEHERQGFAAREPRDGGADRLFQIRGQRDAGGRAHRRHGA